MNVRWVKKNKTMIGTVTTAETAISMPVFVAVLPSEHRKPERESILRFVQQIDQRTMKSFHAAMNVKSPTVASAGFESGIMTLR